MALQVSPNLLNSSLLSGPADAIGGATPQGAIRSSQAGKGAMPGAGTVPASLATFGREFVQLLEAQTQADAKSQAASEALATQAQAQAMALQAQVSASAENLAQGELQKAQTDLTQQLTAPSAAQAKTPKSAAEASEAAAALLAAQMLSGGAAGQSVAPQPIATGVPTQGAGASPKAAATAANQKTPERNDLSALLIEVGNERNSSLLSRAARAQAATVLSEAGQPNRTKAAGLPGQASAPASLESLLQAQTALAGDALAQIPADETAEMEFDCPAMPTVPREKSGVSTLQHLSGKDFMQTLGSARPAIAAAVSERPAGKSAVSAEAQSALLIPATLQDRKAPSADDLRVEDLKTQDAWRALSAQSQVTAPPVDSKPPVVVAGHVVPGAGAEPRLTSESLKQVVQSVQDMQQLSVRGHEQGSFRIRLKPDSLGEIHLKVSTEGNQVSLQVQASDEGARKILESSMGDLRDQLTSRNLNLASVDVGVLHGTSGSSGNGAGNFDLASSHRDSQNAQNFGHESRQERGEFLGGADDRVARALPRGFTTAAPTARASAGRLDVMA